MAVNAKQVKARIKSVKNTQKMTRAMEMVSAAKMRKAVAATQRLQEYAQRAQSLMRRLANAADLSQQPLMEEREEGKTLLVLISSNRGLCGSYNANVMKTVSRELSELIANKNGLVIGIGKKSAQFAKRNEMELLAVYDDLGETPDPDEVAAITRDAVRQFTDKKVNKIIVGYTHFTSPVSQEVRVLQVLPFTLDESDEEMGGDMLLEPNPEHIASVVLPKLVEAAMYQAVLNASASEHSARMMAMKNASENAGDMVKALTQAYNKARQAAITQEISEIVGGAAALE